MRLGSRLRRRRPCVTPPTPLSAALPGHCPQPPEERYRPPPPPRRHPSRPRHKAKSLPRRTRRPRSRPLNPNPRAEEIAPAVTPRRSRVFPSIYKPTTKCPKRTRPNPTSRLSEKPSRTPRPIRARSRGARSARRLPRPGRRCRRRFAVSWSRASAQTFRPSGSTMTAGPPKPRNRLERRRSPWAGMWFSAKVNSNRTLRAAARC